MKTLKKKLDTIFAKYIRIRDALATTGTLEAARCISCGQTKPIGQIHCGHFVRRGHLSTRFDEKNCHAQCSYCNVFLDGNEAEYFLALEDKLGRPAVDRLMSSKKDSVKYSKAWYLEQINIYTEKINNLINTIWNIHMDCFL